MTARVAACVTLVVSLLLQAGLAQAQCKTFSLSPARGCDRSSVESLEQTLKAQALSEIDANEAQTPADIAFSLSCTSRETYVDLEGGVRRRTGKKFFKSVTLRSRAGAERSFELQDAAAEMKAFLAANKRSVHIVHQGGGAFQILDLGAFSASVFSKETELTCLPNATVVRVKAGTREFTIAPNESNGKVSNRYTKPYYIRYTKNVDWPAAASIRVCFEPSECAATADLTGYVEGSIESDKSEPQVTVRSTSDESKPLKPPGTHSWKPEYGVPVEASVEIDGKIVKLDIEVSKPLKGALCNALPKDYQGYCTKGYSVTTLLLFAFFAALVALLRKYWRKPFDAMGDAIKQRRESKKGKRPNWLTGNRAQDEGKDQDGE